MRKLIIVLVVCALGVGFGSMTASAATSTVTLDPSSPITVTFGTGGSSVSFAPTSGAASGTGLFAGTLSYGLSAGTVPLTQVFSSPPFAGYTATPETPITFVLNSMGGPLLTGTIDLTNLTQLSSTVVSTVADLDITGGTICSHITCGDDLGSVVLNLAVPNAFLPTSDLSSTVLGGTGILGSFAAISATPEPSSILLFGTGLLAVGGILRRRRRA
jgi:hypothetical protein